MDTIYCETTQYHCGYHSFYTTNGQRDMSDKLMLSCERGENWKNKGNLEVTCSKRVECPFWLRSVSSRCGWNKKVRCDIHNYRIAEDLDVHGILDRLIPEEREFVSDILKYNMTPMFILSAPKDRNVENLINMMQLYKARSTYWSTITGSLIKCNICWA